MAAGMGRGVYVGLGVVVNELLKCWEASFGKDLGFPGSNLSVRSWLSDVLLRLRCC